MRTISVRRSCFQGTVTTVCLHSELFVVESCGTVGSYANQSGGGRGGKCHQLFLQTD